MLMMLPSGCWLTISLLFLSFVSGHRKKSHHTSDNHDWDVLIFNQQWATTWCEQWMERKPSNKCTMPPLPNLWSIHGIWPTKSGTFGPIYCNRSAQFDLATVEPIEKELSEVWSTYRHGSPNHSLWAHEWAKHGTCAAVLENFNTELKYLTRGIEYYKTYNISNILREADIVPSFNKRYDVLDIENAIRNRLGVNPMVKCTNSHGKTSLFEIGICFSKELRICDCDRINKAHTHKKCGRNQPVLYLPYRSSSNI